MADEKAFEETKWWIDRRPVKERDKSAEPVKGIIEKWAIELLKNYNQDEAAKNLVDINQRIFKGLTISPGDWGYYSLEVGAYPPDRLAKIKSALPLPAGTRGIIIDAGFSVRVIITGEPVGARYVDINFVDAPSLDFWVNGQLIEERVFSNVGEALKRIRPDLPGYLNPPEDP
ncbi:MAG: hypothetical protein HW419_3366 [Deltaproteobacteria bacterium]|nr:hypothetical protein [Deltaproteobacteria bacterium]MBM2805473.1 hypothetical protein [Deltaproteobacteria bacterium]